MFGFLRSSRKYSCAIEGASSNVRSLNDSIRHSLLTYSTRMRDNLSRENPIFDSIEIHADKDPTPNIIALAEIFAKELTFLNRTIQIVDLVARRYQEEEEDNEPPVVERKSFGSYIDSDSDSDSDNGSDSGTSYDSDYCGVFGYYPREYEWERWYREEQEALAAAAAAAAEPAAAVVAEPAHDSSKIAFELFRSTSSPGSTLASVRGYAPRSSQNQLVTTLLVGNGQLFRAFNKLCQTVGIDLYLANAMTTVDKPVTVATFQKMLDAEQACTTKIYAMFTSCATPELNQAKIIECFQNLHEISRAAWDMMATIIFANLYRLTKGTEFELAGPDPNDAIFANRGLPSSSRMMKTL